MEMQETVTRDGMLILHLTYCAFTGKVGEEKSVMYLQEKNKRIRNGVALYYMKNAR